MISFRSPEMRARYLRDKEKRGRDSDTFVFDWQNGAIKTFEYWALLPCTFFYDLIAEEHRLLVPKRVFGMFADMNVEEFEELKKIKRELSSHYSLVIENFPSGASVPAHFHMHFIKTKSDTELYSKKVYG